MKQLLLSLLIGLVQCGMAHALGVDAPLPALNHRAFTPTDGAPSDVRALAQTTDGTLWLGGSTGLTRFDGVQFVAYPAPADDPLPTTGISGLAATPDGGLWIGFSLGGATFLKAGRAVNYGEAQGFPPGTAYDFIFDSAGVLWAATSTALARLNGQRWEHDEDSARFRAAVRGFLIDRDGTHWVASADALFARPAGETRFREVARGSFLLSSAKALAEGRNGEIWASTNRELLRIAYPRDFLHGNFPPVQVAKQHLKRPIAFERSGTFWASDGGLVRVPPQQLSGSGPPVVERVLAPEGITSDRLSAIFQDREGNVWIGTGNGIDRFSLTSVAHGPTDCSPSAFAPSEAGAIWIKCARRSEIVESRGDTILDRREAPMFTAAYRDSDGIVWFGGSNLIAHFEKGRTIAQPTPPQVGDLAVTGLVRDASGAIWASFFRGTFRLRDGEWSENGGIEGLPRRGALGLAAAADGTLWFGYRDGRVARLRNQAVQMFNAQDGLDVGAILAIYPHEEEVWVGGDGGLGFFDRGHFVTIKTSTGLALRGISGIVKSQQGDLWLNGLAGISHITRESLEEARRSPLHRAHVETFNHLDGVLGTAPQVRPIPSAIRGTDGRIWFATTAGIVSIDDSRMVRNSLPPPVTIWALHSGEQRYRNLGESITLPVHTTRLQIEYSAGSLTVPERVMFRYRLDGLDSDWQDAGTRREAAYGNLGPGEYRFRVIASNNDGVWNETGATLAFSITPAYYQTRWFSALCGLAIVAILFALYRLRLRHVSAQIRGRLEARLAERERIARELHDTLLQGIQGLILRFQAATDRIPSDEPARSLMEKSLDRADKLLAESRDKVKDLRPSASDVNTLEEALATEGMHFAELHPAEFRVSVQGGGRALHPLVREEGFLIGREALGNAFRHALALNIEIEVTYGDEALQMRIRDDGEGIDPALLAAGGRPGHFGLVGMRERANKLGAHLEVWSKPGAGTEVELRVPSSVAYLMREQTGTALRPWASALRSFFLPRQGDLDKAGTSS